MFVYRAMIEGPDGLPLASPTARGLGIREWEIEVDDDGYVNYGGGGMSVSPRSPLNLPEHRRPDEHGGTGLDPVWELSLDDLPPRLTYRETHERHGHLEPVETMLLYEYEEAIVDTRGSWRRC